MNNQTDDDSLKNVTKGNKTKKQTTINGISVLKYSDYTNLSYACFRTPLVSYVYSYSQSTIFTIGFASSVFWWILSLS